MDNTNLVVVTGLSGSGKSTAIKALEDLDYFCIDNLPADLLPKFLELVASRDDEMRRAALVMDARAPAFVEHCEEILSDAKKTISDIHLLYLTAEEDAIVRRYQETRRRHPLDEGAGIREAVRSERKALSALQHQADHVLDTTNLTVHDLKREIQRLFSKDGQPQRQLAIQVLSFGYKNGVPTEADLMFDVRFLDNPYFSKDLRTHSGKNPDVAAFVLKQPHAQTLLSHVQGLLSFLVPLYAKEGKSYLTIGIGCTGGQHRSVAIAEELAARISPMPYGVNVRHRDAQH